MVAAVVLGLITIPIAGSAGSWTAAFAVGAAVCFFIGFIVHPGTLIIRASVGLRALAWMLVTIAAATAAFFILLAFAPLG